MAPCSVCRKRHRFWLWLSLVLISLGALPPPFGNWTPISTVCAWEWSDYFIYIKGSGLSSSSTITLSIHEVSDLRVRDIKRRLSRTHGYSAEELARILDKKGLIQMLAFEEEKLRLQQEDSAKRIVMQHGIIGCVVALLVILCWPLLSHTYEVAMVNFVVYTDRKKLELQRCLELKSYQGLLGVTFMGILDLLQVWLTASVVLSWGMTSKYFFPIPRLTLRPAQFMGADAASSFMANYGINVGSILVTYGMRYVYGWIERYTGTALSTRARQQRRDARQHESLDDAAARKAARRAMKLENLQRQQQAFSSGINRPVPQPPPDWISSNTTEGNQAMPPIVTRGSHSHQSFLNQLDEHVLCEQEDAWDADGAGENDAKRQSKFDELD
jgi:hypothetical protein